jgi:hypothetical protein
MLPAGTPLAGTARTTIPVVAGQTFWWAVIAAIRTSLKRVTCSRVWSARRDELDRLGQSGRMPGACSSSWVSWVLLRMPSLA